MTLDVVMDIVETNVWIQIARQATVEPVVVSVLVKINVSALVSGRRILKPVLAIVFVWMV